MSLFEQLECDGIVYVDDTNIIPADTSLSAILQKATLVLKKTYDFFSSLNLALNLD